MKKLYHFFRTILNVWVGLKPTPKTLTNLGGRKIRPYITAFCFLLSSFSLSAQTPYQIWNWADLAYINVLCENQTTNTSPKLNDYTEFVLMQDLGVPETSPANYGDGSATTENGGIACTYAGDYRKLGCYGYQNWTDGGFDPNADYSANDLFVGTGAGSSMGRLAWDQAEGWIPIGTFSNGFKNTVFNGNGFKINGLWIDNPTSSDQGLFGFVNGATIEYLGISISNKGIIGDENVAGLAGRSWDLSITNCYVTGEGTITGEVSIGGLIGYTYGEPSEITNSYATCIVVANTDAAGGLAGWVEGLMNITNSYANGDVVSKMSAGGLVGVWYNSSSPGSLENCYATGDVIGELHVGGLVGQIQYVDVKNSYAAGNVIGYDVASIGGLIGLSGSVTATVTITNCFAFNPKIITSFNTLERYGRIVGESANTTLTNNYANPCMEVWIDGLQVSNLSPAPAFGNIHGEDVVWESATNPDSALYTTAPFDWNFDPSSGDWTFDYDPDYEVAPGTNLPILTAFDKTSFPNALQYPYYDYCGCDTFQLEVCKEEITDLEDLIDFYTDESNLTYYIYNNISEEYETVNDLSFIIDSELPKTYKIKVIADLANGCVDSSFLNLTVNATPDPPSLTVECDFGTPRNITKITINDYDISNDYEYSIDSTYWYKQDVFSGLSNKTSYTVWVRNSAGCISSAVAVCRACDVSPVFTFDYTQTDTVCYTQKTYTVTGTASDATALSVVINSGSPGPVTSFNPSTGVFSHTYTIASTDVGTTVNLIFTATPADIDCQPVTETVKLTVVKPVAPTLETYYPFCNNSGLTLADLIGDYPANLVWYDANDAVIDPTSETISGSGTYYAKQKVSNCESADSTVIFVEYIPNTELIPAPADFNVTLCSGATAADLEALYPHLVFYDTDGTTSLTGGLTDNATYYTAYKSAKTGGCTNVAKGEVTVTLDASANTPLVNNQTFCEGATIGNLMSIYPGIIWYKYGALDMSDKYDDPSTLLTNGMTLYAAYATGGACSSTSRTSITITLNTGGNLPVLKGATKFCESITLQQINVEGYNIIWYEDDGGSLGTQVPANTVVSASSTYYAVSTGYDGCGSASLPVNITITKPVIDIDVEPYCEGVDVTPTATPAGDSRYWEIENNEGGYTSISSFPHAFTYADNGKKLKYCVTIGDCTFCDSVTLTVKQKPEVPTFNVTCNVDGQITSIYITNHVPDNGNRYSIDNKNSYVVGPTLSVSGNPTSITVWVKNNAGCEASAIATCTPCPKILAPTLESYIPFCDEGSHDVTLANLIGDVPGNLIWYNDTGTEIDPTHILIYTDSKTFYAKQKVDDPTQEKGYCESEDSTRVFVEVFVDGGVIPAPADFEITLCESASPYDLELMYPNLLFFDAPGGSELTGPLSEGTYYTIYKSAQGCAVDTGKVTIHFVSGDPEPQMINAEYSFCEGVTLSNLMSMYPGMVWWADEYPDDEELGPETLLTDNQVLYVSYFGSGGGCADPDGIFRIPVTIHIGNNGDAPILKGATRFCEPITLEQINVEGYNIIWYNDNGGTPGSIVLATTVVNESSTYYAVSTGYNGCESKPLQVDIKIGKPLAPTIETYYPFCDDSGTLTLAELIGDYPNNLVWYNASDVEINPTIETISASGTGTYYAKQKVGYCESEDSTRVFIEFIDGGTVPAPSDFNVTLCTGAIVGDLEAMYPHLLFYNTDGTPLSSLTTGTTYNIIYKSAETGCTSVDTGKVTVTLTGDAPNVNNQIFCEGATIGNLMSIYPGIEWYDDDEPNGTVQGPAVPLTNGMTLYAAYATGGACSSASRTPITITLTGGGNKPILKGTTAFCEPITLSQINVEGYNIVWYGTNTGGTLTDKIDDPTQENITKDTIYYAVSTGYDGCKSLPLQVEITIGGCCPDPADILSFTVVQRPTCGKSNGSIQVTVADDHGNYTYTLSNGDSNTTGIFENLPAGNYTVTVIESTAQDCDTEDKTATLALLNIGTTAEVDITTVDANSCGDDGKMSFIVTGATDFEYYVDGTKIDDVTNYDGVTPIVVDPVAIGDHTLTLVVNGCDAPMGSFTIGAKYTGSGDMDFELSEEQSATCDGSNGILKINVTQGTPKYYRINGGAWKLITTNPINLSVPAGEYTVEMKDDAGCITAVIPTHTQIIQLDGSAAFEAEVGTVTATTCINNSGTAEILITESGTYSYSLDGGDFYTLLPSGNIIDNLAAGYHDIMIQEDGGCTMWLYDVYIPQGYCVCDSLPDIFVTGCVPDLTNFDTNFTIALRYESDESNICTEGNTFVGDIDGDGFSEIIALINTTGNPEADPNGFRIYDYQAKVKKEISFPDNHVTNYSLDFYAICDLDNDGKSEIIMTTRGALQIYLRVYDCEGNLDAMATIANDWPSYSSFSGSIIKIGVADFDNDGLPEIYFGENIYKYTPGTPNGTLTPLHTGAKTSSIAMDIDGDCIPELIMNEDVLPGHAGDGSVYKVIMNGNSAQLQLLSPYGNPAMGNEIACADIDLDGQLEVITIRPQAGIIDVWDPTTGDLKFSYDIYGSASSSSLRRCSNMTIGIINDDIYPSIYFLIGNLDAGDEELYHLMYDPGIDNFKEVNKFTDIVDPSVKTGLSLFDFNADGQMKLAYRDEEKLYIFDASDISHHIASVEAGSATQREYPVIVSFVPGGESFIVTASGVGSKPTYGTLRIYGADIAAKGMPWMPTRTVWNQYYFYQNVVNDNLQIIPSPAPINTPLVSQDKMDTIYPLNGTNMQIGTYNKNTLKHEYLIPNLAITSVYDYDCSFTTSKDITIMIENHGYRKAYAPIPVNIYKFNGTDIILVKTDTIQTDIPKGGSAAPITLTISDYCDILPYDSLVVAVGEYLLDCDLSDNYYTIECPMPEITIHVEPYCEGVDVTPTATTDPEGDSDYWEFENNEGGYTSITFPHAFTYATDNGKKLKYCVTIDDCTFCDSVTLTIKQKPAATITSTDTATCIGTNITLAGVDAGGTWSSSNEDVATINSTSGVLTPKEPGTTTITYTVIRNGCTNTDTKEIEIFDLPEEPTFTYICTGVDEATITVTAPLNDPPDAGTYEYLLDGGDYSGTITYTVDERPHTIKVRNTITGCTNEKEFTVNCSCEDAPAITLQAAPTSVCGISAITISGNTFINADSVLISHDGSGTLTDTVAKSSPFTIEYTPAAGDIGNLVTITVTTYNPVAPCTADSKTLSFMVRSIPDITVTSSDIVCEDDEITYADYATSSIGDVKFYANNDCSGTPLSSPTSGALSPGSYTFYARAERSNCYSPCEKIEIEVKAKPTLDLDVTPNYTDACGLETVTFTGTYSGATGIIIETQDGDGEEAKITTLTSGAFTVSYTAPAYTTTRDIKIVLTTTGNAPCPSVSETYTITINPKPKVEWKGDCDDE